MATPIGRKKARIAAGNRAKPTPYAKGIGGVTKQAASTAVIYASALDVLESTESLESVDLDSLATSASLDSLVTFAVTSVVWPFAHVKVAVASE